MPRSTPDFQQSLEAGRAWGRSPCPSLQKDPALRHPDVMPAAFRTREKKCTSFASGGWGAVLPCRATLENNTVFQLGSEAREGLW